MTDPLLEIRNLAVSYCPVGQKKVEAVKDFSLTIQRGEILALMGDSGCGKTTLALTVMQLQEPAWVERGEIIYQGRNLLKCSREEKKNLWGGELGFIFQDPATSLNPVIPVGKQIGDVLRRHKKTLSSRDREEQVRDLLAQVELDKGLSRAYPHQLSGGMKQRVMIALALAGEPALLLADEPTSGLDMLTQKQILALLLKINREKGITILLISHDIRAVAKVCHRVALMKQGRLERVLDKAKFLAYYYHPLERKKDE